MENAMQLFNNPEFGQVRVIIRESEPWFAASDVARALGYTNPHKAVQDHCKYVKLFRPNELLGLELNPRGENFIPEPDVYALIFRSNLPAAEKFRAWVCEEVLPTIRKTGGYNTQPALPDFNNPAAAARAWADEYEKRQLAEANEKKALQRASVMEDVLGVSEQWRQVKAWDWVTEVFDARNRPGIWSRLGKEATALSRALGYEVRKTPDSTYGEVNVYHVDIEQALLKIVGINSDFLKDYRKP